MNSHRRHAAYSLLLLVLASCSSDKSSAPTGEQNLDDVIYVGAVTDEALRNLLAAPAKNDARYAVIVDSPDLSTPLPKDSPATFQFRLATETARAPGPLYPMRNTGSKWQRPLHELLQFLSPEGVAHAHGAAYNGWAFYLVVTDANSKQQLQLFTPADPADSSGIPKASFTPEATDWQNLAQAPQPLKLEITSAHFEENNVSADGGPFVGGTFPFRIE